MALPNPIYQTNLLWPTFLQLKPEAQESSAKGRFASFDALVVEFFSVAASREQSHKHVWGNVLI